MFVANLNSKAYMPQHQADIGDAGAVAQIATGDYEPLLSKSIKKLAITTNNAWLTAFTFSFVPVTIEPILWPY